MWIEFTNVTKTYGAVTALDSVSFRIPVGSTFGLLGTNGAGKTTLFELLVGHDTPDRGEIVVGGQAVEDAGVAVRGGIGFLPERVGFPALLTGREVLDVHARIHAIAGARSARIDDVLETVGLTEAADRRVGGYSNGMQTRLGLAAALLAQPPILVLDEPTAGLDPRGVTTFHQLVERLSAETETTIVLASHDLDEVNRLCDEVAILHDGRLGATGSVDALRTASGGTTEVTITTPSDAAASQLSAAIASFGRLTVGEDTVTLQCDPGAIAEVLAVIDHAWIQDIEIMRPGLDTAFHQALDAAQMEVIDA